MPSPRRKIGDPLPSYDWCSIDPLTLGVPHPAGTTPIPELFDPEAAGATLPFVTAVAEGKSEPLVQVTAHQVEAAYWQTGWPFTHREAFVRSEVAARLETAANLLPDGFGLAVWDAWRDPRLQQLLYETVYVDPTIPPGFVNPPSDDPATPPPHATGGTVDVTLTWKGKPLALGTAFDAFVDLARARSLEDVTDEGDDALARDLRRVLWHAMCATGFVGLACEWWHFEYGTRLWAAIKNQEPRYPAVTGPAVLDPST